MCPCYHHHHTAWKAGLNDASCHLGPNICFFYLIFLVLLTVSSLVSYYLPMTLPASYPSPPHTPCPAPLLWASAHRVAMGSISRWLQDLDATSHSDTTLPACQCQPMLMPMLTNNKQQGQQMLRVTNSRDMNEQQGQWGWIVAWWHDNNEWGDNIMAPTSTMTHTLATNARCWGLFFFFSYFTFSFFY